jgi:hypothetical protein
LSLLEFSASSGGISAARPVLSSSNVKSYRPPKAALILAMIALALMIAGIALNHFGGGHVRYSHYLFALTLLAFIVWFWGRTRGD